MPKTKTKLTFTKERDTKNTMRFAEQVDEGADPIVGTLYIRKDAIEGEPTTLTVEITTA